MTQLTYLALLQNAALLLGMVVVFDLITHGQRIEGKPLRQILAGGILGVLSMGLMLSAFKLETGIVFDTRSVLLGVAGLFLGTIPTLVAMVMAATFRVYQGGAAAWAGAGVIFASGGLGIAWRHYRRRALEQVSWRELYAFGVVVHVVMLACMLTLPWETARRVLIAIGPPVLLLYPVATTALGLLLSNRLRRERTAAELAESEERHRGLFENNHATMLIVDPNDGAIVDANPAACRFYGWTREQLRRMRISQINALPPEQVQAEMDVARATQRYHFLFPHRLADGSVREVEVFSGPVSLGSRRLLYSIVHDITERKQAERRVRTLSRAVEQSPVSIVITDPAGNIEYVNPRFTEVSGYTLEEALGQNPRILKSGDMSPEHYERLWQTILKGQEWRGELQNRKKNGALYWESASISSITDAAGEITHFVAVKEDITGRKRLDVFRQALLYLGDRLNNTQDPVGAGRALLEVADQFWNWDAATLDVLIADTDERQPVLSVDTIAGVRRELPSSRRAAPTARMRRVMQQGAELILRDAASLADSDSVRFGDTTRLSASIMCVPIRREAQTVGILSVQSYTPQAYSPEDLQTLQALADYCGGALNRIRSEEALQRSEERYRGLVETTFDWIWEVDANGRYTYASPKVKDLLGYTPEEVLGRTPFDFMPETEAQRIGAVFQEVARRREAFSALENINRHKEGRLVVLESSGVPVLGPGGEFRGYRGMDRDVTARKQAESALIASEERFRTLVENAPTGVFIQANGGFVYVNEFAIQAFGAGSRDRLLGKPVLERMQPDCRDEVEEQLRIVSDERRMVPLAETRCVRLDGTAFDAQLTAVPFISDGQLGALVFFHDITETKRLEMRLRQAQKLEAIGQLAGGVAHDFNNILAAIMMHLGLLQMNPQLDDETRQALKDLETEAQRAAELTRQLLMFSRRSILAIKALDLNDIVGNMLKMLRRLIGEDIDLRFEGKSGLPAVMADAGMLEQVVLNLVVNARDAMPRGGHVTLRTTLVELGRDSRGEGTGRRPGTFVCLTVMDTGSGMDAATQKRIFEPFFTTKEIGKGTGLGLATVDGIVAQHKGWIEMESHVGRGTVFQVYLPALLEAPAERLAAPRIEALRGGKETLLLVEDDAQLRRGVGQTLRQLGYRVIEAGSGQEAIRLWQEHELLVDLLFTDMVMPEGITGLELAEKLRTLKPGLKVIISSGYSAEMAQVGVPTRTGVVYLPKPYATPALAGVVRSALDSTT